jgi:hypothetical protein
MILHLTMYAPPSCSVAQLRHDCFFTICMPTYQCLLQWNRLNGMMFSFACHQLPCTRHGWLCHFPQHLTLENTGEGSTDVRASANTLRSTAVPPKSSSTRLKSWFNRALDFCLNSPQQRNNK